MAAATQRNPSSLRADARLVPVSLAFCKSLNTLEFLLQGSGSSGISESWSIFSCSATSLPHGCRRPSLEKTTKRRGSEAGGQLRNAVEALPALRETILGKGREKILANRPGSGAVSLFRRTLCGGVSGRVRQRGNGSWNCRRRTAMRVSRKS